MTMLSPDERAALAEMVDDLLTKEWSTPQVRRTEGSPDRWSRQLWESLAEVDVLTLGLDPAHGGADVGMAEFRIVSQAIGRHLAIVPYVWSSVLATRLAAGAAPGDVRDRVLAALGGADVVTVALPRGDALVAPGHGHATDAGAAPLVVPYGAGATHAIVLDQPPAGEPIALSVVALDEVGLRPTPRSDLQPVVLLDRPTAVAATIGRLEVSRATLDQVVASWKVAVAAVALGGQQRLTEICATYATERIQFGRPIGAFQAIAHPIADMHVRSLSDEMLVDLASWYLDLGDPTQAFLWASQAKAAATRGFAEAGTAALQVHGGHGFSEENDVQLFFRAGCGLEVTWGSPEQEHQAVALRDVAGPGLPGAADVSSERALAQVGGAAHE